MKADAFLELPNDPDDPLLDKNDVRPDPNDESVSASAGRFLSNELFYRVAGLRDSSGRGASATSGDILPMGQDA